MPRWLSVATALLLPCTLVAQAPAPRPSWDFSALLFGNFQMRTDSAAKFATGGNNPNRFDVGRAYLTFRAPAGDRASVRITTDIFQNTTAGYYSGWTVRLKYGILQYDLTKNLAGVEGLTAAARIGMLHTVVIEHVETFWPRWLGNTALESNGFFSSADVGAAMPITFPKRRGEAYLVVTNGPGYTSAETDRFKDIAARVSLTPFANDSGWLRSFTITPWYYKGATASAFILGGGAQVGPVSDGVQRDRRGLFLGLRDRKLTLGGEFSQRLEELESGANTAVSPRVVRERTSNLTSLFTVLRPMELFGSTPRSRLGLVGRLDRFKIDTDADPASQFVILGATWDLNDRTAIALDYQGSTPRSNPAGVPVRTWFLHWTASF
jgi:hypothetical protein